MQPRHEKRGFQRFEKEQDSVDLNTMGKRSRDFWSDVNPDDDHAF